MLTNKNLPAWFFTNEALAGFLSVLPNREKIKKIYGIAGGGDFAFNFLSQANKAEEVILCDIRSIACVTVENKIALFKKLSFNEIDDLLASREWRDSLKKTKNWYPDSFLPLTRKKEYLLYLTSKEKFEFLKRELSKIKIFEGDFLEKLSSFDNGFFDLIYSSDIFDHKVYCPSSEENLKKVKDKLSDLGCLLVVTQEKPKKIIKKFESQGFRLKASELHRFHIFKAFWRYDYSFLLFEKI